jgi:hypothetical protein
LKGKEKRKKNTKRMKEEVHKKKIQMSNNLQPCNTSNKIIQKEKPKGSNLILFTRSG